MAYTITGKVTGVNYSDNSVTIALDGKIDSTSLDMEDSVEIILRKQGNWSKLKKK